MAFGSSGSVGRGAWPVSEHRSASVGVVRSSGRRTPRDVDRAQDLFRASYAAAVLRVPTERHTLSAVTGDSGSTDCFPVQLHLSSRPKSSEAEGDPMEPAQIVTLPLAPVPPRPVRADGGGSQPRPRPLGHTGGIRPTARPAWRRQRRACVAHCRVGRRDLGGPETHPSGAGIPLALPRTCANLPGRLSPT